jgi:predicted nucleic acid-binding protein
VPCEPGILENASRIKAQAKISMPDSWIAATAIAHEATLVHKNPEFTRCKEILQEVLK